MFNRSAAKSDSKRNNHAYKANDKIIRVENGCPQIISKELFEKVQRIKAKNQRNTGCYHGKEFYFTGCYHGKEFYLLTGKIFCGVCGKRIQGNLRFSGRNKTRLSTYRCPIHRIECRNKELNKDYLDAYIVVLLEKKILNTKSLKNLVKRINSKIRKYNSDYEQNYSKIKWKYEETLTSLNHITEAIEKGLLTDNLIARAETLEEEKASLETRLKSLQMLEEINYSDVVCLLDE